MVKSFFITQNQFFIKKFYTNQKRKYAKKATKNIPPATLESRFFGKQKSKTATIEARATIVSILKADENGTGITREERPTTNRILKILLPTIFPIAISAFPFLAAETDVTSSGRDVPKATIVSPTMTAGILKLSWTTCLTQDSQQKNP